MDVHDATVSKTLLVRDIVPDVLEAAESDHSNWVPTQELQSAY